jgi:hypothetical protein
MTKKRTAKLEWQIAERRLERAGEAAEEIVDRLRLPAPIDPLRVAREERQSLRVTDGNFRNRFDGQLEYHRKRGLFVLLYNNKYDAGLPEGCHHPRTRFSIAHELGHYFLERHHAYFLRGGRSHGSKSERFTDVGMERDADAFAAGLLLPRRLLKPVVNQEAPSLDRVVEISKLFDTSFVSTALRCVQLSDYPCAVVGVREGVVAWSARSERLVGAGFYPPARGSQGSASCREQWRQMQAGGMQHAYSPARAGDWFRTFDGGDLAKLHVEEYYLPVCSMKTLVVILCVPEEELEDEGDD